MPRRREINVRAWSRYLAAFDLHLAAIRSNDPASIAITRAIMRHELQCDLGDEIARREEWGGVGFPDHPPFPDERAA